MLLATTIAACSSPARAPSSARPSASTASPAQPSCPNTDGGLCIGALQPGRSYATTLFAPAISYSVPDRGWVNDEDLAGNFLLVPPKNTLPGVNAGTSDFIGVYTRVTAARFEQLPSCTTQAAAEVANTPQDFADWLRRQHDVVTTVPAAVTVGGLHGLRIDLKPRSSAVIPECTDDQSGDRLRYFPILMGEGVSGLDHGLIPNITMRLYLLNYKDGVLAIEVDDIPAAPGTLSALSAVAEKLRFTR